MKLPLLLGCLSLLSPAASAQNVAAQNVTVQNHGGPFAEGILNGYFIQANGRDICANPYVIGRYISCGQVVDTGGRVYPAQSHDQVWFNGNGQANGMAVIDKQGRELCANPFIQVQFRGPESYILC